MENRAYAFAVGLFTLLLAAGVVVAAMWLSGDTEKRVTYMLESRHPVTGLNVQARPLRPVVPRSFSYETVAEALETLIFWERALNGGTPAQRLASLLDGWSGRSTDFSLKRERVPREGAVATADRHLVRLWARDEIERLRSLPGQVDAAVKLALQNQLVTSVSGAVVLETQEQYDRHGLKPVDPATVPVVPEPGTATLLALGAAWLATRRSRRAERVRD